MWYEFLKLFRQIHVKAAFFVVVILSAVLGMVSANSFRSRVSVDHSDHLTGKRRLQMNEENMRRFQVRLRWKS